MAFIMEQAGGAATTGSIPILDIQPEKIHERCPVILGSKDDVQDVLDIIKRHADQNWECIEPLEPTTNTSFLKRDQNDEAFLHGFHSLFAVDSTSIKKYPRCCFYLLLFNLLLGMLGYKIDLPGKKTSVF